MAITQKVRAAALFVAMLTTAFGLLFSLGMANYHAWIWATSLDRSSRPAANWFGLAILFGVAHYAWWPWFFRRQPRRNR